MTLLTPATIDIAEQLAVTMKAEEITEAQEIAEGVYRREMDAALARAAMRGADTMHRDARGFARLDAYGALNEKYGRPWLYEHLSEIKSVLDLIDLDYPITERSHP